MERRLIRSGSPWEARFGYSRAVVVGPYVYVSGTAPSMPDDADPPPGAYAQARRCLDIIEAALEEAGARPEHVVRTRIFVTDAAHVDEVMRAHAEVFETARPATTGVITGLLDPRWLVEIEAEAYVG